MFPPPQSPKLLAQTVKLFWKTNSNVDLGYYSNSSVVSVVGWDNGEHRLYSTLHVDEGKVRDAIAGKDEGAEEEVEVVEEEGRLSNTGKVDGMRDFQIAVGGKGGRSSPTGEENYKGGGGVNKMRYMEFIGMRLALKKGKDGKLDLCIIKLGEDNFDPKEWVVENVPEEYNPGTELERHGKVR